MRRQGSWQCLSLSLINVLVQKSIKYGVAMAPTPGVIPTAAVPEVPRGPGPESVDVVAAMLIVMSLPPCALPPPEPPWVSPVTPGDMAAPPLPPLPPVA